MQRKKKRTFATLIDGWISNKTFYLSFKAYVLRPFTFFCFLWKKTNFSEISSTFSHYTSIRNIPFDEVIHNFVFCTGKSNKSKYSRRISHAFNLWAALILPTELQRAIFYRPIIIHSLLISEIRIIFVYRPNQREWKKMK